MGGGLSPETLQPSKDMELTIYEVKVGSDFMELVRETLVFLGQRLQRGSKASSIRFQIHILPLKSCKDSLNFTNLVKASVIRVYLG